METLQATGQVSGPEMDRIVPPTAQERQQAARNDKNEVKQMKHDIAYLLQQVQELNERMSQVQALSPAQSPAQSETAKTRTTTTTSSSSSSSTGELRKESKGAS